MFVRERPASRCPREDLFTVDLAPDEIIAAARTGGADVKTVNGDIDASAEYRRAMIPVFTRRALERAAARA